MTCPLVAFDKLCMEINIYFFKRRLVASVLHCGKGMTIYILSMLDIHLVYSHLVLDIYFYRSLKGIGSSYECIDTHK
jgi:hypothetical protein